MNVPKGWERSDISRCANFIGGSQPPQSTFVFDPLPDHVRLLQIRDYKSDRYATYIPRKLANRWCEADDIMIGRYGPPIFQILRGKQGSYNVALIKAEPSKKVERQFLYYLLKQEPLFQMIDRLSPRTSGQTGIDMDALKSYPVSLPTLPEQRKIADILSTWDEALTQLDALIEVQERRKKALMQQLLTGKKRFPGFKGKWKKVGLGEVAENVADANKGRMGTTSLYGVTKADGVVPMRDHVKGESFDRCKRVETDWFAYNPMRINIGSIARWQGAETVMVSGDYVVFRCHPDKLLPAYLDHLRQSWMWQSFVTRGGNGSVRIRIYFSDLAEFTFPCPPLEEQRQIAAILDTADQQLTLLRTQRTALDQQKRGLMQRLLTGKLRVKP